MSAARRGLTSAECPIGARVRLTGHFLRITGQLTGPEGLARWQIVACPCLACADGHRVAVDEPDGGHFHYDDFAPAWRHLNPATLERVGARPKAADYP